MRTDIRVVVLGLAIALSLFAVRYLGEEHRVIPQFLAIMAVAFVCYFAALFVLRKPNSSVPAIWTIIVAVLIQVAPFRGMPVWDNDAYRYHWDGLVLAHGINPFKYAPGDHKIAHLRDEYWEHTDYKEIKTIYPPITQFLLAATYFLDSTPRRVLLLAMGFNLLTLWPLLLLLRARGVDEKWLALYAWNPLLANEFAIGGHLDPISVCLLLAALYSLQQHRYGPTGALVALSVMAKTQMVVVAPLLLWRSKFRGFLAFAVISVALVLPFADVGAKDLLSGSLAYLGQWEYNSGIFAVLRYSVGGTLARVITGSGIVLLVAWLTFRRGDVLLHAFVVLGALLLLSPTFFPWYVSWVLPFVCFYPTTTWIAITFLLLAPYLFYYDKALGFMVRGPEIVMMYLIGAVEYALWRRRQAVRPPGPMPTPPSPDSPSGP